MGMFKKKGPCDVECVYLALLSLIWPSHVLCDGFHAEKENAVTLIACRQPAYDCRGIYP